MGFLKDAAEGFIGGVGIVAIVFAAAVVVTLGTRAGDEMADRIFPGESGAE